MKKINLHIANIGTKMKLKVGFVFVPNDSDTNTNYFRTIPTINKFSIGENHYINITVTPYVTIDISKGKDKNDSWSSNMQISFNRFQLFQFIRSIKKVIGAFNDPRVNLFMYRNNKLVIDTELSKELTLKSIGSSNKVAVIEPAIIQLTDVANNVDYYEGVNFYINSIDNYCSLTYDEFYYLEYELAKIDLNSLSLEASKVGLELFGDSKLNEERDISNELNKNRKENYIDLGSEEDGISEPLIVHNESRIPDIN